ncbi:MAG: hybrid sensor histidine kinase/response regulator [Magnetococcus sp. DMHC-1]|nr:hybrid sensor histidine kinase/response regulator [Magnetococcales bacterium]
MEPRADRPKILLVDDEAANLKLLREILRQDYRLVFARNVREMLQYAAEQPDLILLDIMMPEMDGYTGCQMLKDNPETRDIPVIFVTAKVDMEDEIRGLEVGAVDYLTKPVLGPVVRARVKTHLALRQARETIIEQNREIQKQNEALKETARLRDDVEQIIRHDLKGPLNAIIGMPDMLIGELALNERQEQCLRVIEDCGFRLLGMINLSHDLYKMERGLYSVDHQPVDMIEVLQQVVNELQEMIRSKKLVWRATLNGIPVATGDTFMVSGEKLLYHSMLSNLVKNAIEASPRGETLLIDLDRGKPPVMRIRNKGSVPAEIRATFFDKFVTAGKSQGTGLGTYSAKLIATTLGGDLSLDTSQAGETSLVIRFMDGKCAIKPAPCPST